MLRLAGAWVRSSHGDRDSTHAYSLNLCVETYLLARVPFRARSVNAEHNEACALEHLRVFSRSCPDAGLGVRLAETGKRPPLSGFLHVIGQHVPPRNHEHVKDS